MQLVREVVANTFSSASTVTTRTVEPGYVITTIKSNGNPVTQYYVTKKGESRIVSASQKLGVRLH